MTVENSPRGNSGRFTRTYAVAQKDAQAAELRRTMKYDQIAAELGYASASGAYKAVQRAIKEAPREAATELVTQDLVLLHEMQAKLVDLIEGGPSAMVSQGKVFDDVPDWSTVLQSMGQLLKVMERRSKLVGLDAPTKNQITITDEVDQQIQSLVAQLGQLDASPAS